MSNQSAKQASVRAVTGTAYPYEGDWHALFDMAGIPVGSFNGRMLAWINDYLGTTYTELNGAMAAFAQDQGYSDWNSMGEFDAGGVVPLSALRFASIDNNYYDGNPAVSPKSNAGANAALCRKGYRFEDDFDGPATFLEHNDQITAGNNTGPGNSVTVSDVTATYNGVTIPLTFLSNGLRSYTLANNETDVPYTSFSPSDFGATVFAKGTWIVWKAIKTGSSLGANFACENTGTDNYSIEGEPQGQFILYNTATATPSDPDLGGKFTFTSGSAVQSISANMAAPILVASSTVQKRVAPLCLVDSIGTRFLNEKFLREQFGDNAFPLMKVAVPGIDIASFNTYQNWEWLLDYCDDVFINIGTNDIGGGQNYASVTGRYNTLINRIKTLHPDIRIHMSELLANTTSSNNWIDSAGQATKTGWMDVEPDLRFTYFPSLVTAETIYGVLNTSPVRDPVNQNLHLTDGITEFYNTYDGIHLSSNANNGNPTINESGVGFYNGFVLLPYMRSLSVELYGAEAPAAPTDIQATAGDESILVDWVNSEYDGGAPESYAVQYKLSASSTWLTFDSGLSSGPLEITGLTNASNYDVRVLAVNSVGSTESSTVSATPTAETYDPSLSSIFDCRDNVTIPTGTEVSNWQDKRGNTFNYVQATSINRPTQAAPNAGLYFGNNMWLTLDTAQMPHWFDIVFEKDAVITNASPAANLIHYADAAPTSLTFGASTGVSADEVIVYSIGTYKAIVTATNLLADTGSASIPTGKHVISVRYQSGSNAQIWLDGVQLTVVNDQTNVQSFGALIPSIGAQAGGSRDLFGTIYEVRHYSAVPVESVFDTQTTLMTEWSI